MEKISLNKPVLFCFYGYSGSGKSYVARNLVEALNAAYVNADRVRHELFKNPRYDAQENAIVAHLMNYMTEEFLRAGVSVVYDINATRYGQRRKLKELAHRNDAKYLLIWLQTDPEHAFDRTQRRDRRRLDDKYSEEQTKTSFEQQMTTMQNPQTEEYLVISGKHSFATQKGAIFSRLYQEGLVKGDVVQSSMAAPGLVNLVPNPHAGRVDMSRRNITVG